MPPPLDAEVSERGQFTPCEPQTGTVRAMGGEGWGIWCDPLVRNSILASSVKTSMFFA